MINKRVIPIVPCSGSLGASGDLAQLSRVGNAMMGIPDVMVKYQNKILPSDEAMKLAQIKLF